MEEKTLLESLEDYHLNPEKVKKENEKLFIKDFNISFDGIMISEIILRKDFDSFYETLKSLYSFDIFIKQDLDKRNIEKLLNDNNFIGKTFLPIIRSEKHLGNLTFPVSIEFIKINIQKSCSDFITVDIIFFMKDKISEQLNNIILDYDYPEIIENFFIEGKGTSYNILSVNDIKKNRINNNLISNIKKECLIFISPLISKGEIYNQKQNNRFNNFASLNIYSFTGDKNILLKNRDFLNLINFSYNSYETYEYDDKYYLYEDKNIYTLLIDGNKFENYKIDFSPYLILDDFDFYLVSFYSYLISIDLEIDKISNKILNKSINLKNMSELKELLISKFILFDRLGILTNNIRLNSNILSSIDNGKYGKFEENKLGAIKRFITERSIIINRTILNINSLFELKNTTENLNLQNKLFWFTLIMFFLGLIQIIFIQYNDKKYIYEFIFDFIRNIFIF